METSTGVASSLLGKRKVETPNLEDSGESDGDKEDSTPEWDKDSFDGGEYHSSDHNKEYSDEEFHKKCVCYRRAVIETKAYIIIFVKFQQFLVASL